MSELWVERHRPQSVGEIRGQASVVSRLSVYAEHKEFPHMLFADHPELEKLQQPWRSQKTSLENIIETTFSR